MLLTGPLELADVGEAALDTLHSLLSSLPAFYGAKELTEIAKLYVDYSATSTIQHNPLTGLSKAISKRTSAEVLLPVLYDLWPNVDKAQTKVRSVVEVGCEPITSQGIRRTSTA
jgi:U3 small nucleolar RNA-associated protein 10